MGKVGALCVASDQGISEEVGGKIKKREEKDEFETMEVENKPQPLAGFSVGTVSHYKRAPQVKRKPVDQLFRKSTESEKFVRFEYEDSVPPPPLVRKLTPMSELLESMMETDNSRTDSWQTASFFEEIPPPPISRQLTPMSNLLESLL